MTPEQVIDIARETIWIVVKTSAPMLGVSLVVGLIISIFQTVTSIQEQTLTFVPKLLAIFAVILLCGNWIMTNLVQFLTELCTNFGNFIY